MRISIETIHTTTDRIWGSLPDGANGEDRQDDFDRFGRLACEDQVARQTDSADARDEKQHASQDEEEPALSQRDSDGVAHHPDDDLRDDREDVTDDLVRREDLVPLVVQRRVLRLLKQNDRRDVEERRRVRPVWTSISARQPASASVKFSTVR